ncbi:MAG TPA: lysophospholipid acyltransferase family protein [Pyrinomonadaceae bacterium]|jgi:KDO2-lipid IV(A) lauroyltransferase|nr:lysophospholipid acyltransferase family protein [Pyrinomonadaceae bacterium]
MSKSNLQTNLEYVVARCLLTLFAIMPVRAAMRVGACLASGYSWFPSRQAKIVETNLKIALTDLSATEKRRIRRGAFAYLGRLLGVFSHFRNDGDAVKQIVIAEGLEHLTAAQTAGRGVILFTGHVGAWELSSFALSLLGHPLSFLVRRIDNPKVEVMIDSARRSRGNRTIDKRSAAREMLEILRGGGTLGILVDLNTLDREAIFVNFFGKPASTTFIVAKLALRTGAPVLPVFAPWDETRKRFVLKIDQPLAMERTGDEEDDVRRLTQQYTQVVEDYVRRYPDQWLWIHRRWKTRPAGEKSLY